MLQQSDFNTLQDWSNYLYKLRLEYETLSSTHIRWYTHKNPAGCWICDLFRLLEHWEDIYYPSPPKNVMNSDKESPSNEGAIKSD